MTERQLEATALRPEWTTSDTVPLPWLAAVLIRDRWVALKFATAGLLLSLAGVLLKQPQYVSAFSFVPATSQDQSKNGLASLAGQFGISLGGISGGGQSPQLYLDIVNSRDVLTGVAADSLTLSSGAMRRVTVADFLKVKGSNRGVVEEKTVDQLRDHVINAVVATRTSGSITVSVTTPSPDASLQIAQRLLDGINHFNRAMRQTQAGEERRFIEARLSEAKDQLRAAEDHLQQFLQQNRIAASPQLKFDQERLERVLTLQQQVVGELSQQFEDARIREVRDTPVISVIDLPALPTVPLPAHRLRIVVLATFAAGFVGLVFIILRAGWGRRRQLTGDPSYDMLDEQWRSLRNGFRRQ